MKNHNRKTGKSHRSYTILEDHEIKERCYEVRSSSIHNRGVFASRDISQEVRVIEYVGETISKKEAEIRAEDAMSASKQSGGGAVYLFTLDKKHDIDGAFPWNPARLINHSCEPNCEVEIVDKRIWVVSVREIKKGEELSFNYGFDLDDFENHPCRCGTNSCVGYILGEDYWKELKER